MGLDHQIVQHLTAIRGFVELALTKEAPAKGVYLEKALAEIEKLTKLLKERKKET